METETDGNKIVQMKDAVTIKKLLLAPHVFASDFSRCRVLCLFSLGSFSFYYWDVMKNEDSLRSDSKLRIVHVPYFISA